MNSKISFPARMRRVTVVSILLAALPVVVAAQETVRSWHYFPRFGVCDNDDSGIALINPNGWEAAVTLNLIFSNGTPGPSATVVVPGRGQVAKTAGELFGGCVGGWLEVTSPEAGIMAYYQAFDARGKYMDGAQPPAVATEMILPVIPGIAEGLAEIELLNPNPRQTAVDLSLWSMRGTLLGKTRVQVPAGGLYTQIANDVFPAGTDFSDASHITLGSKPANIFSQAQPLSASTLFAGFSSVPSIDGTVDLAALNAVTMDQLSNSGVLPQFRTGPGYTSTISLVNAEPSSVDVTLTAMGSDGSSLGSRTISMQGNGGYRAPVQSVFPSIGFSEKEGWVLISATGRVSAAIIHGHSDAASLSAIAMQKLPSTGFIFPQVAQGGGYSSEITLVNASESAALADLYVMKPDGTTVARNQVAIAANGQVTRKLVRIVPEIGEQSGGFVFVHGNAPMFSTYSVSNDTGSTVSSFAPLSAPGGYSPAPLETLAVSGVVMLNDMPASGFRVVLSGPSGTVATTSPDGTYAFTELQPGRYSLAVDQFGFQFFPALENFELTSMGKRQDFLGYTEEDTILVQPAAVPVGSPDQTAIVFGRNFNASSQAYAEAIRLATTFVDPTQLRIVIPEHLMSTVTSFDIYVVTNDLGPDRSASKPYSFVAYVDRPSLSSIATNENIVEGSASATVTLNGQGFLPRARVKINGLSDDIQVTFINPARLLVSVPAKYFEHGGILPVTVENPYPANIESNVQLLTVYYPAPTIELVSPGSVPARLEPGAGPLNIEVLGYGFRRGATVFFKGKAVATSYCENDPYCLSVHLYATIPASELRESGFAQVVVQNPSPSLGASQAVYMRIDGLEPVISSAIPGTGSVMNMPGKIDVPLLVNGYNFGPQTLVRVYKVGEPVPAELDEPDEVISSTQLLVTLKDIDHTSVGEWRVQVGNPQPGGGLSQEFSFFITAGTFSGNPSLSSLNPGTVSAGGPGFTLVINGTNFRSGAQVQFNTTMLPATVVSSKQIMVEVPPLLIQNAGRVPVSVINPDTGGASNRLFIDIR